MRLTNDSYNSLNSCRISIFQIQFYLGLVSIFILYFFSILSVQATPQINDVIFYQGEKNELVTHWAYPSPLEIYFRDESEESPFSASSTANYRGHVADWEIKDNKLYLVGIKRSDQAFSDKNTDAELEKLSKQVMTEIFTNEIDTDNRVFASWYSGNLEIFNKRILKEYRSPYEKKTYKILEPTEVSLVQVKNGVVQNETNFPFDEFWRKYELILKYNKLEQEDIAAISDRISFIEKYTSEIKRLESLKSDTPSFSEDDFDVFLTRYLSIPVKIPLTDFSIVKDATLAREASGWTGGNDLRNSKGKYLIFLEMGASNVPKGPWSNHVGGAVQVVIKLDELISKKLTISMLDNNNVHLINNFGGPDSIEKTIKGTLKIDTTNERILLTGQIQLATREPTTHQEFIFENKEIPIYSIKEYLKKTGVM